MLSQTLMCLQRMWISCRIIYRGCHILMHHNNLLHLNFSKMDLTTWVVNRQTLSRGPINSSKSTISGKELLSLRISHSTVHLTQEWQSKKKHSKPQSPCQSWPSAKLRQLLPKNQQAMWTICSSPWSLTPETIALVLQARRREAWRPKPRSKARKRKYFNFYPTYWTLL